MANKVNYTENDRVLVSTLKGTDGMTIAEINAATGLDIKPGSFTGAVKKGLIEVIGTKEVVGTGKRDVTVYSFVTSDALLNAEGKAYNYTDGEKAILAAASTMEGEFMLSELAKTMNRDRLTSGSINGLVKKGNIAKNPEKVKVDCAVIREVNVYGFVKDVPTEA